MFVDDLTGRTNEFLRRRFGLLFFGGFYWRGFFF
jgi:hypothetical protein